MTTPGVPLAVWWVAIGAALGVRLWNALAGPLMWGYDAWGHAAYVIFLDLYRALPWADQGWSYYHPPLHYALGWTFAQLGSGEALMRGLALLGSAASLGTAGLAAWVVRRVAPEWPALAPLAFVSVAFLPVHLVASPMPGNDMTAAFFSSAAVSAYIANQGRPRPSLAIDALTGVLLGLALLTKFTGVIALAALGVAPILGALLSAPRSRGLARACARSALVVGAALLLVAPHYAPNAAVYGTPFPSNSDFPLLGSVEGKQPPGERSWSDYVRVSPRAFADPDPLAPHLLHSVWGTLYLNVWADTYRESDVEPTPELETRERRVTSLMALLGLLPTALAGGGAILAALDLRSGRRRTAYLPLLLLSAAGLAAFVRFSWGMPTWAALKASYLLPLSLPYAAFLCRGVEALAARGGGAWRWAAPAALTGVCLAAGVVATAGLVLPRRADSPAAGAVHFYFGEYDAARRSYQRLIGLTDYPVAWLDNLAAVELADGDPQRARRLYARAVSLERSRGGVRPYRAGQLAVATALAGDLAGARALLDETLAEAPRAELRANRGAIRAQLGDLEGAEADLRAALDDAPALVPAWRNLAWVLARSGGAEEAQRVRERAAREACRAPRGYPYGVGTGEVLEWGVGRRWLLRLDAEGLRVALPSFYREACRRLADQARAAQASGADAG